METLLIALVNLAVAALGFVLGRRAKRKPELFWRYLVSGTFLLMPLMIGGFTWYEEIFALLFLFGNLPVKLTKLRGYFALVFVFLCVYLVAQSFRGMFNVLDYETAAESARKIRWPIYFLALLGLFYASSRDRVRLSFDGDISYRVAYWGLILNSIHLLWGIYAITIAGSAAFTQYSMTAYSERYGYLPGIFMGLWGATSYVHSLYPLCMLAILKTMADISSYKRNIATISFCVAAASVVVYDSRSGGLAMAVMTVLALPLLGLGRFIRIGMFFAAVSVLVIASSPDMLKKTVLYADDLKRTLHLAGEEQNHLMQDVDRKVWLYSAIPALTEDLSSGLFGYGLRMSGYIVAPHVNALFEEYGIKKDFTKDVGTEAITNIAVDTGFVGLGLFALCFLFTALEIFR
ncbi:hypothetical protein HY605_00965, partial [Candidatus Peregrinibacteria bacterium]|nr:hypothetical protein [Candidatus Peregrinibacteria bacterium]